MRFNTKNQIRPWTTQMEIKSWIKRPCECTIAHDISLENVSRMHELSEAFHAISLRHTCLLSILEQFSKLSSRAGYVMLSLCLYISIYNCHFY
ncbi:ARM repeat protein interacting with ABF2 [Vitis vinifera]|uniref:ARM repeat protein interacting with ABF2 n=1 Tax=Vitis vinifera TaxID=29760 RepID=A0A438CI16_VITVI|nr:ARM repeat protein interacting with ABF2 [Vitis vinifera]